MYFDTLTLAAVVGELRATVLDGRVQRVVRPSQLSIALEVYNHGQRFHMLLSAHPQFARMHLVNTRPSRGVEGESQLLLLLRKYVLGGRITAIEQPDLERVVLLSIVKGPQARNHGDPQPEDLPEDDDDEATLRCELVVEAMDRRSNIILVGDDNLVKESVRHIPLAISRRPVLPRQPYELPPRQDKLSPLRVSAEGLRTLAATSAEADFARALVSAYAGLSPQVAREVLFRAVGASQVSTSPDLPFDTLAAQLRELFDAASQPSLIFDEHGAPRAYAPYLIHHLPDALVQPSMSMALETFYAARERLTSHTQRRSALDTALGEARERLDRQRRQLAEQAEQARGLDKLRWEGEMIYAFLHALTPGQTALEVEGQMIMLNPKQSPVENAQARFKAYDKSKNALAHVPELLRTTEARIAGLDETRAMLALAESFEQIEDIAREIEEQELIRPSGRKRMRVRRQPPLRVVSSDGFAIYVGRSAGQNEHVTFKLASADDLWLHTRKLPGAHVVIKSGAGEVPERTLLEAAALAAYYSSARHDAAVEVEVARRRYVRRVPGGPLGLVSYQGGATVRVAPRPAWS
ncbi:MAG: NFACT family protein [Roseiflexaceae bacterium]|nr:NFACT family protein [Roseiflexaceae bacterium]